MNQHLTLTLAVMLGSIGCGGDDATSTPDAAPDAADDAALPIASVTVTSASCMVTASSITTDLTLDVVLEAGQGVDVDVGFAFAVGTQTRASTDYDCGGWSTSMLGNLEVGCARGAGALQQVVTVRDVTTLEGGTLPTTVSGEVTGYAWSEPLPAGGSRVAMGSRAIQCSQN